MIKAIVTDIEGTTTSLAFVKDVLFPYAHAHLGAFVHDHAEDASVKALLADTCNLAGISFDTEAAVAQLLHWLDEDKKITPLKALQGLIWEAGYHRGDFHGHIYADAAGQLQHWKQQGLDLYVYSSGSVQAQKLLFAHTDYGDLTPLFSGYFDTNIGGKREMESYRNIAKQIQLPPEQLLFLSDIEEELDAAQAAGFHTIWLKRETELTENTAHRQVSSFTEITGQMLDQLS
ncbi:MAG: acireductone synthase [Methylovulum sp.]|uniref:acireductone synthase n=1 Tax=Methylovulum sp. TaxID=1916980 RepID=UPI002639CEC1|nr:acireductone synthase [Methylovulum sp.]MDD2722393.1 acireductone synthase [Methylovulum sp.]MDD5125766.1 acireductone synthase [Methylovulum sp.]